MNYQQTWAKLRGESNKEDKKGHLLPRFLRKQGSFFTNEDGCMVIRNDILARAFQIGTPDKLMERPECASFTPSKKRRK